MVLRGQQGADVALQHEIRTIRALDRFDDLGIGRVNQLADLPADGLLPLGKRLDVRVDTLVRRVRHGDPHDTHGQPGRPGPTNIVRAVLAYVGAATQLAVEGAVGGS